MGDRRGRGGDEAPGHRLDAEPRPRPNNHPQGNKPRRCRPVTEEGPPGAATGPPPPPDDATPPTQSRRGGPDPLSLSKTPPKPPTPPASLPAPATQAPFSPRRAGGGGCGGKRGTSGQGRARMGERRPGRRGAGPGPEAWGAVGEESTRSGRAEVRADIRRTEREPRPGRAAGRGGRRRAPRVSRGSEAPRGGADPTPERRHGGPPPRRHVPRRGEGTVREAARRPGTTGAEGDGRGARAPPPNPLPALRGEGGAETEDKARQGAAGDTAAAAAPGGEDGGRSPEGTTRGWGETG